MRRFGLNTTVALLAATMAMPVGPGAALAQSGKFVGTGYASRGDVIKLGLNKSFVLELPSDAYDILVANPAVADAVTRTARRIYLFGKSVGQTNVIVFGPNGEQIGNYDIAVERDVAGLEGYLERFIPGSDITVELLNDNVVLTGTVDTPLDAARAAQLAQIFVTGGEATTGQYAQTAAAASDGGGVDINNPDSERQQSRIVNLIQIVGEDQVTLKVTVAEVSRSVMKQLGVNLLAGDNSNGFTWGALSESSYGLGKQLSPSGVGFGTSLIDGYIQAMEQAGVMKTLAEPTLTAVSGEQATFRVGGEFNIVNGRDSTVSLDNQTGQTTYEIEKIEYGIGLEFKPTVLSPGRISLKVRTSVSEPTSEGSVNLEAGPSRRPGRFESYLDPRVNMMGTNMISIRKRLADTTIELPSGGSMMIAGLVRDDVRQVAAGLPGLSKIPVLGALFRSKDFVRNETELVIIVTPYLSRPVARNELAKPDDNFNPASDGGSFILNKVNRVYGTMKTDLPNGRYHGVVGYIYK
ncbi:type II and III secretion system protein family protein [Tianweitania sediminis]|uniref:Type II and III secretion system protein family protein n=2 Tax=Tianweitania sediminis TaxID=1502156 RepID=A0A8J7UL50_9HYPH|nr:type II and III secretion system protein family protein [Tianweitania sediminis]